MRPVPVFWFLFKTSLLKLNSAYWTASTCCSTSISKNMYQTLLINLPSPKSASFTTAFIVTSGITVHPITQTKLGVTKAPPSLGHQVSVYILFLLSKFCRVILSSGSVSPKFCRVILSGSVSLSSAGSFSLLWPLLRLDHHQFALELLMVSHCSFFFFSEPSLFWSLAFPHSPCCSSSFKHFIYSDLNLTKHFWTQSSTEIFLNNNRNVVLFKSLLCLKSSNRPPLPLRESSNSLAWHTDSLLQNFLPPNFCLLLFSSQQIAHISVIHNGIPYHRNSYFCSSFSFYLQCFYYLHPIPV